MQCQNIGCVRNACKGGMLCQHCRDAIDMLAGEKKQETGYIPVPVEAAAQISRHCKKSMVVILAYDPVHEMTHATTFGVSAFDKENAAAAGEMLSKAIGGDLSRKVEFEDFHADYDPAIFKEAVDILTVISRRQGTTSVQLQQIERFLRNFGRHTRQG